MLARFSAYSRSSAVRPGIDSRIGRGIFFIDQAIWFLSDSLALARRLAVAVQRQFIVSGRFCVILRFIRRQTRLEDVLHGEGHFFRVAHIAAF